MTLDITFTHILTIGGISVPIIFGCIWLFLKSNRGNFEKLNNKMDGFQIANNELSTKQHNIEKNYLDRFKETNENINDVKDKLTIKLEDISNNLNTLIGEHRVISGKCVSGKNKELHK